MFDFDGDLFFDRTINQCFTGTVVYTYTAPGNYVAIMRVYDLSGRFTDRTVNLQVQ
jgi:hypothetical protein